MTVPGTPESAWTDWPVLDALPTVERPAGRVVVVSAHPDDEVLGAGGLLAAMADAGSAPRFVTVSDGEASHPGLVRSTNQDLAGLRAGELRDSLRVLGFAQPDISRLRLPDSGIADYVDELAIRLRSAIEGADLVLCPARIDGHIDHATVGEVVAEVCAGVVPVWEFPIWIWHWTTPADVGAPWDRARRVETTPERAQRKRRALACFASQVAPIPSDTSQAVILPSEVLEHFLRPYEVFFT